MPKTNPRADVVWETTLDKRYHVVVTRVGPYRGELTIAEKGHRVYREEVGLAFDSLFGPDVADVAEWQEIAVRFADGREESGDENLER